VTSNAFCWGNDGRTGFRTCAHPEEARLRGPGLCPGGGRYPIYVYLPKFYTDVVGIEITALGTILASVRIFDAVTDPPWDTFQTARFHASGGAGLTLPSAPFRALFIFLLFNPPEGSPSFETVWFGACIYALFLFWTVVTFPTSLSAPRSRSTTTSAMRFSHCGTAFSSPVPWPRQSRRPSSRRRSGWHPTPQGNAPSSSGSRSFMPRSSSAAPGGARFPSRTAFPGEACRRHLERTAAGLSANRPFMILIVAYTISAIGNNLPATLILFYVNMFLESPYAECFPDAVFRDRHRVSPGLGGPGPPHRQEARVAAVDCNQHRCVLSGVLPRSRGTRLIYACWCFCRGSASAATLALPSSIQADVIDYDELLTGERRGGRYIGLWSIAKKLAAAVGVGAGLSILGLAGYIPNAEQPEAVLLALRVLYALVPSVCNLVALVIAFAYPISGATHQRILEAIERRQKGEPVEDPLKPGVMIVPEG